MKFSLILREYSEILVVLKLLRFPTILDTYMLKIESISETQKYRRHIFTASRFINALMLLFYKWHCKISSSKRCWSNTKPICKCISRFTHFLSYDTLINLEGLSAAPIRSNSILTYKKRQNCPKPCQNP